MNILTMKNGDRFILLSTQDDLMEFNQYSLRELERGINQHLKRTGPALSQMNWGVNDSIVKHQTQRAELGLNSNHSKLSPICNLDAPLCGRMLTYQRYIEEGLKILVNMVGGYRFLTDDMTANIEKTESVGLSAERTQSLNLPEKAQYINLENDPVLEQHTIKTLRALDTKFASIVNLRLFDEPQLTEIFAKFVKNGGHTVYVYTTGSDVEQMYMYTKAAVAANVSHLWIQLNSGVSQEHTRFEQYVKTLPINVRLETVTAQR